MHFSHWHDVPFLVSSTQFNLASDDKNRSRYIFFLPVFFFYYWLMISRCFEGSRRVRLGGDDKNGPKQHVWCRLGPKYVLFFLHVFYILNNDL